MKQEGEGKEWNDPFFSIGLWKVLKNEKEESYVNTTE